MLYVARCHFGIKGCYYESTAGFGGYRDTMSRTNIPAGHTYAVIPVGDKELLLNVQGHNASNPDTSGWNFYTREAGSWGGNTGIWSGNQKQVLSW